MSEETTLGASTAGSDSGAGAGTTAAAASTTTAATGGSSSSWRDTLPEDIRGNAAISSFQDVPSLTKAFIHAQTLVGKKGAIVPGEKSTPEDWKSFYDAIGVPAADKYSIKAPEGVAAEVLTEFKSKALENGLLPKQAEAILDWYSKFEQNAGKSTAEKRKEAVKANIESLKKEWGDGYDREVKSAQLAVKEFGGDPLIKYLNETGVGNDPMIIKAFAKAAKMFNEDKFRENGISDGKLSTGDIQNQIDEIMAKRNDNGYADKSHPMHDLTVKKIESLYRQKTGGR